jgi:hypothetical protein
VSTHSIVRQAAAQGLAGREGPEVTTALLGLAADSGNRVRHGAAEALAGRHDLVILYRVCRRWRVYEFPALKRDRRYLADLVTDLLYLSLPPEARPRMLRRLGKLTQ